MSANHKQVFIKKFEAEGFLFSLIFLPKGSMTGTFLIKHQTYTIAHELSNGLYLQQDGNIDFTFSIKWLRTDQSNATTYFFGNIYKEVLYLNWLLVCDDVNLDKSYTRHEQSSMTHNGVTNTSLPSLPYPCGLYPLITAHLQTVQRVDLMDYKLMLHGNNQI